MRNASVITAMPSVTITIAMIDALASINGNRVRSMYEFRKRVHPFCVSGSIAHPTRLVCSLDRHVPSIAREDRGHVK
jgi:hypothetical protein